MLVSGVATSMTSMWSRRPWATFSARSRALAATRCLASAYSEGEIFIQGSEKAMKVHTRLEVPGGEKSGSTEL